MGLRNLTLAIAMLGTAMLCRPAFAACNLAGGLELPVVVGPGHPIVTAKVNGADVHLVLDTGAYYSSLTPSVATRLALPEADRNIDLRNRGVGGETGRVPFRLAQNFTLAGTDFRNVVFELNEKALGDGLLGENFLAAETVEYDLAKGAIRFFRPEGCATEPLAYWATTQPYSVVDIDPMPSSGQGLITGYVVVNGAKVKVVFDTGAPTSIMTLNAAARAGVRPFDPGVYPAGVTSGIALHSDIQIWNAPFASFKIGDEQINNPRIFIGPMQTDTFAEMLLGEDFFRSHRVIVSHAQNRLYFTYNGGQVFAASFPSNVAEAAKNPATARPLDAEGFGKRARAYWSRQDYTAAIADLTQAMALAPNNADYPFQRGQVYWAAHKSQAAMTDFDQSLTIKPDNVGVLLARANLHLQNKEMALAKSDLAAADGFAAHDPRWGLALGEAYSAQNDLEKSIHWLDAWIAATPGDTRMAGALNERCWARALLGRDLPKALADCNASLDLLPGDPSVLDSRGLVRLRLGDFDGAIVDYNRAIASHPNEAWSYYGRSLAELNKGMTSEGEEDERKAKRLVPDILDQAAKAGLTRPSL